MLRNMDALHYRDDVAHASVLVNQLRAELEAFERKTPDDPLLYAYALRDSTPQWMRTLLEISSWSGMMLDKDNPGIPDKGAKLCPT